MSVTAPGTATAPPPLTRAVGRATGVMTGAVLAAWALGCSAVAAYMLAAHLLTLPAPAASDRAFRDALVATRGPGQHGWLAVHVLFEQCKCSRRVLDHLLTTPRPAGISERIVLVDDDGDVEVAAVAAARAKGLEVEVASPASVVARYRVEVAPLLVVLGPDDTVRYVGGYTRRKQGSDDLAAQILHRLVAGERVAPLPAFGCAVSASLARAVDPLGIR